MGFKFEKLEVWQKSIELGLHIHELTKFFPKEELYILTSQIKRAADSIALNIAEGSTGQTNAEFKLFLGYAILKIPLLKLTWTREMMVFDIFDVIADVDAELAKGAKKRNAYNLSCI
jgi:hypothetical protein